MSECVLHGRERATFGSIAATTIAVICASALSCGQAQAATSAPPSPHYGGSWCTAAYQLANKWAGGFVGIVTVRANGMAITGWTVELVLPGGQVVTTLWNGSFEQVGNEVDIENAPYNGSLVPGGPAATFGFVATGDGAMPPVKVSCFDTP